MLNVITIDGGAASGKTSVGSILRKKLGGPWRSFTTGLLYRTSALGMLDKNIPPTQEELVSQVVSELWSTGVLSITSTPTKVSVCMQGRGVLSDTDVETLELGRVASIIAAYPSVRKTLFSIQRSLAESEFIILDGRDCGTVIAPDAKFKFFLQVSPEEAARRRVPAEVDLDLRTLVYKDILDRNTRDSTRKLSPMIPAEDAVILDTTTLSLAETIKQLHTVVTYQPKIYNLKLDPGAKSRPGSVYIGRPGPWGNPFEIGKDGTREEVLAKYLDYLRQTPNIASKIIRELRGKDLVCFCHPKPCHGDILQAVAQGSMTLTPPERQIKQQTLFDLFR